MRIFHSFETINFRLNFTKEPEENLDCPDLIEEYEKRIRQKSRFMHEPSTSLKRKTSLDQAPVHNKRGRPPNDSYTTRNYPKQATTSIHTEEQSEFDRGLDPEKILGATDTTVNRLNNSFQVHSLFSCLG